MGTWITEEVQFGTFIVWFTFLHEQKIDGINELYDLGESKVLTIESCLIDLYLCAQEEGRVTLRLMSKAGRVSSAGNVVGIVRNLISEDASRTVGRVRMLKDGPMEGAAFDLPEDIALEMLAKKHDLEVRSETKPSRHIHPSSSYLLPSALGM